MNDILANYDEERIREFADEGDPREPRRPIYCADCGDEDVDQLGRFCAGCAWDAVTPSSTLPSHLYTEIMTVCQQVLDPENENVKRWDVVASVRDLAQLALAAKEKEAA